MDMCGQLLARVFAGFGISKVLTAQTGGLPPAHAVAWMLESSFAFRCITCDFMLQDNIYISVFFLGFCTGGPRSCKVMLRFV